MLAAASTGERALVRNTVAHVCRTRERFAPLMCDLAWHPIPYFGRLSAATIVTLGLNPSAGEFAASRRWPAVLQDRMLADRLTTYYDADPHLWFKGWAQALETLGAAYGETAAHVDLSPRPTASVRTFSTSANRDLFLEMLRMDAPLWLDALGAAKRVRLVLIAGSATNRFYINEFIQAELQALGVRLTPHWRRGDGEGQVTFQQMTLPSGRQLPTFFCSTGPSKPSVLVAAVNEHASRLRELSGT